MSKEDTTKIIDHKTRKQLITKPDTSIAGIVLGQIKTKDYDLYTSRRFK